MALIVSAIVIGSSLLLAFSDKWFPGMPVGGLGHGVGLANETVTVRGPRGRRYVARVADPSWLDQAHVGDNIVMTFTEATAVSLTPAVN